MDGQKCAVNFGACGRRSGKDKDSNAVASLRDACSVHHLERCLHRNGPGSSQHIPLQRAGNGAAPHHMASRQSGIPGLFQLCGERQRSATGLSIQSEISALRENRARLCHFRNVGFMARLVCFRNICLAPSYDFRKDHGVCADRYWTEAVEDDVINGFTSRPCTSHHNCTKSAPLPRKTGGSLNRSRRWNSCGRVTSCFIHLVPRVRPAHLLGLL